MCSVDVRKMVRNTVKSVDIDSVESLRARRPQPGMKKVLEEDDQERKKAYKTKGGKGFQERKSPWKKGRKVCCWESHRGRQKLERKPLQRKQSIWDRRSSN